MSGFKAGSVVGSFRQKKSCATSGDQDRNQQYMPAMMNPDDYSSDITFDLI